MGRKVAYFGDGFQKRVERYGRKLWWIPTLGGEFVLDRRLGYADGLMGGNLWFFGDRTRTLHWRLRKKASARFATSPGVITTFPGGVAGSGSKAGSRYTFSIASTYEKYCPQLRDDPGAPASCPKGVQSVMEIIMNGQRSVRDQPGDASCNRRVGGYAGAAADLGRQLRWPLGQEPDLSAPEAAAELDLDRLFGRLHPLDQLADALLVRLQRADPLLHARMARIRKCVDAFGRTQR